MSQGEHASALKDVQTTKALRSTTQAALQILTLMVPVAIVVLCFFPTFQALTWRWTDGESGAMTHGWLVAGICVWLLAKKAATLPDIKFQPAPIACFALLILNFIWLLAFRTSIEVAQTSLLPLMMLALTWGLFGYAVARQAAFPVGYFAFALSFWGFFTPVLQWGSIYAARVLLRIVGVPASFYENTVQVPSGTFVIEGGCSGIHYFVVALSLATLYGELQRSSLRIRLQLIALGCGLAILANWLRVFTIVMAGHLTHMQHYLVRVDHVKFGWAVFAIAMTVFFFIAARITPVPAADEDAPVSIPTSPPTVLPRNAAIGLVLIALASGPLVQMVLAQRSGATLQASVIPSPPAGWTRGAVTSSSWQPVFEGADSRTFASYSHDARALEFFRAEYSEQHQGKKLAGFANSITGNTTYLEGSPPDVELPDQFAQRAVVDREGHAALIWYSYYVGKRHFSSPFKAQVYYGLSSFLSQPVSGVVALRTTCEVDCASAANALGKFVQATHLESSSR